MSWTPEGQRIEGLTVYFPAYASIKLYFLVAETYGLTTFPWSFHAVGVGVPI